MADAAGPSILFLSARDVAHLAPAASEVEAIVVETLRAEAAGRFSPVPRVVAQRPATARFIAFPAILDHLGVAGVKWLGIGEPVAGAPQPTTAHILLSEALSGALAAIVDAGWITLARTVTVSVIAAKAAASPASRTAAFIGCGRQALAHLEALRASFPLERIIAAGRSPRGVEAFLDEARRQGLAAQAAPSLNACVEDADIVISTASSPSSDGRPVDPRRLKPGAFASLVDLGRVWAMPPGPGTAVVVDELPQYRLLVRDGAVPDLGEAPLALGDLVAGSQLLPRESRAPTLFLPTGYGAADLALAARLCRDAQAAGVGVAVDLG